MVMIETNQKIMDTRKEALQGLITSIISYKDEGEMNTFYKYYMEFLFLPNIHNIYKDFKAIIDAFLKEIIPYGFPEEQYVPELKPVYEVLNQIFPDVCNDIFPNGFSEDVPEEPETRPKTSGSKLKTLWRSLKKWLHRSKNRGYRLVSI